MNDVTVVLVVVVAVVGGGGLGWFLNSRLGARSLAAARVRADESIRGARREAEKVKQAAILEAREETFLERKKVEHDFRSRKGQLVKRERDLKEVEKVRAAEREELDLRERSIAEQSRRVEARELELQELGREVDRLIEEQNVRLERVSGLSSDEARRQLIQNLRAETRFEAAGMIKEIKEEAQKSADNEARKIIALAIERLASEVSSERTVTVFPFRRSSEMKGRIIGHEGKNIRAFERVTGMQLVLDEEAESITISGFNPVQRELARRILETLLKDGNIHPRRIEDLHRRNLRRLEDEMRKTGQQTVEELGLEGVAPEIVQLVGRLKYRTSYGQNVLQHSKEVAWLTAMMAAELRLDERVARRAGLLHDIGKAIDYEREGTHPEIGAEIATRCEEDWQVINAIASHHEDCEMTTPISVLVAAADALSGARPGARRKSVAEYIKRIERLEDLANSMDGVSHSYALQAGREIRVIAHSGEVDDARMELLASDLAGRIQTEMDYPGKIKVTVIREVNAVEYAN